MGKLDIPPTELEHRQVLEGRGIGTEELVRSDEKNLQSFCALPSLSVYLSE